MNKKFNNIKLKAGALQYTIFISVVIALLVFAFISLFYVQGKLRAKASFFQEVVHAANQSFEHLTQQHIPYNEQTQLKVSAENKTETKIHISRWGIFDLAMVTATRNKEMFTRTALLGGYQQQKTALYLLDENQPLVVVGNTRIEGKAYLPEQGIKRGTIAGNSYLGNQLIYGTVAKSKGKLATLQNSDYLKTLPKRILSKEDNIFIDLVENTRFVHSFSEPTKVVSYNEPIDLRFMELAGNIIVHSATSIRVYPSAILKDVLLIAPEIEILANVKGNFQGLATKMITVGSNCKLAYPTALVLVEKEKPTTTQNSTNEVNQIVIHKGAEIKGVVVFINGDKTGNYEAQIVLEENTMITGEVYCNKNIELKGTVKGGVYTKGFIANQFGSVYKNHIYNGSILGNDIPPQYSGLSFTNTKPTIAKWLYY